MVSINILWDARIWLIFWIFSSTCFCVHQLSRDFEFLRKITSSSNDSTNGAPSVSGNHNASSAEVKLAAPKISRGSSLKVIMGRYRATLKIDDIYNVDYATKYSTLNNIWELKILNKHYTSGAVIPPIRPAIDAMPRPVVLTTVGYISTV